MVGMVVDSCGSLRATCTGRRLGGGWAAADPAEQECGDAEDAGPDEVQMQVRARRDLRSRKEVYEEKTSARTVGGEGREVCMHV